MDDFGVYEERVSTSRGRKKGVLLGLLIIVGVVVALWYFDYLKIPGTNLPGVLQESFLDYVPGEVYSFVWTSNISFAEKMFGSSGFLPENISGVLIMFFSEYSSDSVSLIFTKEEFTAPQDFTVKKLKDSVYVIGKSTYVDKYFTLYSQHSSLNSETKKLINDLSKDYSLIAYIHRPENSFITGPDEGIIGIKCKESCTLKAYVKASSSIIEDALDSLTFEYGEENIHTDHYNDWFVIEVTNIPKEDIIKDLVLSP